MAALCRAIEPDERATAEVDIEAAVEVELATLLPLLFPAEDEDEAAEEEGAEEADAAAEPLDETKGEAKD